MEYDAIGILTAPAVFICIMCLLIYPLQEETISNFIYDILEALEALEGHLKVL